MVKGSNILGAQPSIAAPPKTEAPIPTPVAIPEAIAPPAAIVPWLTLGSPLKGAPEGWNPYWWEIACEYCVAALNIPICPATILLTAVELIGIDFYSPILTERSTG